ncbi:holocytochrome c synthase [Komagataella kurtzmanii]|nr:holocytochrome c synthase [Komagataella kurtzmanii]
MGWFWADSATDPLTKPTACPVNHVKQDVCPVKHDVSFFKKENSVSECPVKLDKDGTPLNPLNNMPYDLSSARAPGQKISLPTQRTLSTIPKGETDAQGVWEYPSPQQMLNAMLRKGKGEIAEDAVESMVDVHNFLNEGAWQQILAWEKRHTEENKVEPRLLKFTGRPYDLSPRAAMYQYLGKLFPSHFSTQPPFDRHDWTVLRSKNGSTSSDAREWSKVRYVIDYYGGPDDEDGMPTFFLDVRPALDNSTNVYDRFVHWNEEMKPVWAKALGKRSR